MHDTQPQSKELGDTPLDQSGGKISVDKDARSNINPQDQSITGVRLALIIVALMSAMFLVALVSHLSTLRGNFQPQTKINSRIGPNNHCNCRSCYFR